MRQEPPETDPPLVYHGADFTDFDIPLGISRKVTLRTIAPPGRVPAHYFNAWPLRTVLRRRRQRRAADGETTFHGARLFPSVWNVLLAMHHREPQLRALDATALAALQADVIGCENRVDGSVTSLDGQSLHALVEYLSRRDRLTRIALLETLSAPSVEVSKAPK